METVTDRMQHDILEEPWALELQATGPGVCDTCHPHFHLSSILYVRFTYRVPQFQTSQGLGVGVLGVAGLASLLPL